jgi:hypothetical protein
MLIYDVKKRFLKEMIQRIEDFYGIKFYDPIRYDDFYYRFTQRQDGLYIFGDNGMLIKNGRIIVIYDLSLSDVGQAYFRRDNDSNFCFFIRMTAEFDCGSTGDALTTVWNIEGQMFIWWCFEHGYLVGVDEWPKIRDYLEEGTGFLGYYWSDKLNDWYNAGNKCTGDSARKAISVNIARGIMNVIDWKPREDVKRNEILALAISSGMIDIKLTEFNEWVHKRRLDERIKDEEKQYSMTERIKLIVREEPEFLELSDANLEDLAYPYSIN